MEDGKIFSDYVRGLREEKQIGIQALCEGLCTWQEVSYLETGRRKLRRVLQEAILERLGVGAEDYEHFVDYVEYRRLMARQKILHGITLERFREAEGLLEEYSREYCEGDKLEQQFYLSMMAQIRQNQKESRKALGEIFKSALELTVPDFDREVADMALSLKELNLLLETERYREQGERPERYREIADYITGRRLDPVGKAKIYPKAVYFYCRCALGQGQAEGEGWSRLLRYCNQALEILRESERMYFLWEILGIRKTLLARLAKGRGESLADAGVLEKLERENGEWMRALEGLYGEFGVNRETFEYCWLYVPKGIYCINDVIRIRRGMLGLSQKELCRGICDVKSLRRLEKCETVPQRAVWGALFQRLGLSREYSRTELVTEKPEAMRLMRKIGDLGNEKRWEEAEKLLDELGEMVSLDIPSNRQVLMRYKLIYRWKKGEMENGKYCEEMKKALELTLPYEAFLEEGEKYLTNGEASCIENRMKAMANEGKYEEEFLVCMKHFEDYYQAFVEKGLYETISGMYEYLMGAVGSNWGNRGEYDRADKYSSIIMQEGLRLRRGGSLNNSLYDRWWNNAERKKKGIPASRAFDDLEELTKCILFSKLFKHVKSEQFYRRKLILEKERK